MEYEYKFTPFKWLARADGFGYPIDVYYGTIYLGLLNVESTGVSIKMVDGPLGKVLIKAGETNNFKNQLDAAKALHKLWKILRKGNEPPEDLGDPELHPIPVKELKLKNLVPKSIVPSPKQRSDSVLLIPNYENKGDQYPGDIKPGYYSRKQLAQLLLVYKNDVNALQFIADMLETGNENLDFFVKSLRQVLQNPTARNHFIKALEPEI